MANKYEQESRSENEPERYVVSGEVQKWIDEYVNRENGEHIERSEWMAMREELKRRFEENPEYELAYLRYQYPDPNEPGGGILRIESELLSKKRFENAQAEKEQAERTPINSDHNILTHYEETRDAMAQIEGEAWRNRQERDDNEYSLKGALKFLDKIRDTESNTFFQVYGNGGINRWFVKKDGTVYLSKQHASERTITKAKLLGFQIFE